MACAINNRDLGSALRPRPAAPQQMLFVNIIVNFLFMR